MAVSSKAESSWLRITPNDLKDVTLERLNQIIRFMAGELSSSQDEIAALKAQVVALAGAAPVATIPALVPRSRATQTGLQAIPNTTWTALILDTNEFDNGIHSTSVNPTQMVCPADGIYDLRGLATFVFSGLGSTRIGALWLNATTVIAEQTCGVAAGVPQAACPSCVKELVAGDIIEIMGWQDTGGGLNTNSVNVNSWCSMVLLEKKISAANP